MSRSANRTNKLQARRDGKPMNNGARRRIDREKTSRCWYQLKTVHKRSEGHFTNLGTLMAQYNNVAVFTAMTKEETDAFRATIAQINEKAAIFETRLAELWARHEHKKTLCHDLTEMVQAFDLFEAYQTFDTDLFTSFKPLFDSLTEQYNGKLDAINEFAKTMTPEQVEALRASTIQPTTDLLVEAPATEAAAPAA
jgi:hypothetical protein